MESQQQLLFQQFGSFVDFTFWHELTNKKLDEYRLSEDVVELVGFYSSKGTSSQPSFLRVASESFRADTVEGANCVGTLLNVNTIESFKTVDRKAVVARTTEHFLLDIASGAAERNPQLLTRFALVTFADLKQYKVRKQTKAFFEIFNVFFSVAAVFLLVLLSCGDCSKGVCCFGASAALFVLVRRVPCTTVVAIQRKSRASGASGGRACGHGGA
jgi:hypothetical protein